MKLRACFFTLLLPLFYADAQAQDDHVLREIETQLIKAPQMLGRFEQKKTLPQLPRPLLSDGVLALSEGRGVSWRVSQPIASHLILSNTQSIDDPVARQIAYPLMQILQGNFRALGELFAIEARVEEAHWQLTLKPKGGTMANFIGSIEVAGADKIETIRLTEANSALTEIRILDLQAVAGDSPLLIAEFENKQQSRQ